MPWSTLVELVRPHSLTADTRRPPFGIEMMLRIHYLQQWFGMSDAATAEALHDIPLYREFAKLDGVAMFPDETAILRFRRLLERHPLATDMLCIVNDLLQTQGLTLRNGTAIDAALFPVPSLTDEARARPDLERTPSNSRNRWYFGMEVQ